METTGFFKKFYKSMGNFSFYRSLVKESLGKAFTYLILLSLLIGAIGTIKPVYEFTYGINVMIKEIKNDIPNFQFKDGTLIVEGDTPVLYEDEEGIVVIDTTGELDESVLVGRNNGVFVLKHKMIYKENAIETREIDFRELGNLQFTKATVEKYFPLLKWMNVVVILFIIIGTILGKLISTLVISSLGMILNAITKAKLTYGDVYKLGIYAITLPSLIKVFVSMIGVSIPFFWVVYYGIVMFYIWKVMTIIKEKKDYRRDELME